MSNASGSFGGLLRICALIDLTDRQQHASFIHFFPHHDINVVLTLFRIVYLNARAKLSCLPLSPQTAAVASDVTPARLPQGKFEAFAPFSKTFNADEFDYRALETHDSVFMRWKESFLIPDHLVGRALGAAFWLVGAKA